ncbi:MAG: OmpA family protein [Bacteroidota bacterium]|nr:OmpA family protein [Bacteroidota bacterium]
MKIYRKIIIVSTRLGSVSKMLLLIGVFFISTSLSGQTNRADKLYNRWDYYKAAKLYEKKVKKNPDPEIYFKIGESYRKMNKYREALLWYNKVNAMGNYNNPLFYFNYGLILKNNDKCEEAKQAFNKYSTLMPGDTMGRFYSLSCDIIKEDHQWEEPVSVDNLQSLNTKTADFSPVLYKDGLVYTSSRKTENHDYLIYGWTGEYYLDLFYAKQDSNKLSFHEPVQLQENMIDLAFHDGSANFTDNFKTIYISRTYHDLKGGKKKKALGINRVKIFYTKMGEYKLKGMEPFIYNNDTYSVAHPFISRDGMYIYFSSDMPGGYGDADIYVSKRIGNTWAKPQNLGPEINTFGKEAFPYVDSTGNLYFSSDGYQGFGALDICVAFKDSVKSTDVLPAFKKAKVMKTPFNSPANDFGIAFIQNGRSGYFSSNRYGGLGDDDIYYFDLNKDPVKPTLVSSIYTIGYRPYEDLDASAKIHIQFTDKKTKLPVDSGKFWRVDAETNKYDEVLFTNSLVEFTVQEKTKTRVNVLCKGYDLFIDSIVVPNLLHDTDIYLVYELYRTPVVERIIIVKTPDNKVKGKSELAFFDFAKYNIRPDAAKHLDSVVYYMMENMDAVVDISAHTDVRGSEKYNMNLSEQRARSAMNYLQSKGISAARMHARGYGYSRLVNRCAKGVKCSEAEHQENRRVEFWIKAAF